MNVSAVIPVRDTRRDVFAEALASLRSTGIASEIILVDDGSTASDTVAELRRQSESGARVVANRGHHQSAARATGAACAVGEYIMHMDSDDLVTGRIRGDLAPVNLARNNTPNRTPVSLWDYLERPPAPLQWGAIVRTDLARYLAMETEPREEDIAWSYRLMLTAWRDGILVNRESGVEYAWREPGNRNTDTARCSRSAVEIDALRADHLEHALGFLGLCSEDRAAVRLWRDRRKLEHPYAECHRKGERVDVHTLTYSRPAAWLQACFASLRDEPCNLQLVVGGFPGSIGAARAFAFTLGDAEYVSFVDDDDLAVPGVMQQLVDVLDEHPEAVGVYTDIEHFHNNARRNVERKGPWNPVRQVLYGPEITHLKVMRRSAVEPYLEELATYPTFEEYFLVGAMVERGIWIHVPVIGARKRFTPPSGSSMRLGTNKLWNRAVRRVTPVLMRAAICADDGADAAAWADAGR